MYIKAFLLCFMNFDREQQQKDGEIGNHKQNEKGALNMK